MSFESVNPIWRTVRDRFTKSMLTLTEEELSLRIATGTSSVGFILRHNAEVEYMFAEWFFNKKAPEGLTYVTNGPDKGEAVYGDVAELLAFLEASDQHLSAAMQELPENAWDEPVSSPIGSSTPREAIGRVLYHAGLHGGQVGLIRKHAAQPANS
ncbi:DinB family protein [Paenibacillus sp. N1-5-1-14]|uniref:DinB family protein n=1 Tax=Paenibacillus radicibacter TaxID=2972488 RepID=UPI0021590035|nr:DinB family protein [Paenibacillus radicibacter]MCR8644513.1 DinB family protein [Paenibacillus radicibacter]